MSTQTNKPGLFGSHPELIAQNVKDTTGLKLKHGSREPWITPAGITTGIVIVAALVIAFWPKSCKAAEPDAAMFVEWDGNSIDGLDRFMAVGGWVRLPESLNPEAEGCAEAGRRFTAYALGERRVSNCFKDDDKFSAESAISMCAIIGMELVEFDVGIKCRKHSAARLQYASQRTVILFQHIYLAAEWDRDGGVGEKRACAAQHGSLREHWYIVETVDGKQTVYVLAVCVAQPNTDSARKEA